MPPLTRCSSSNKNEHVCSAHSRSYRGKYFSQFRSRNSLLPSQVAAVFFAFLIILGFSTGASAQQQHLTTQGRDFFEHLLTPEIREELVDNPISPPDTSSPRATIESYLFLINESIDLWLAARDEADMDTSDAAAQDEKAKLRDAGELLHKASGTFDFSSAAAATGKRFQFETMLQLWEILQRIPLPTLDEIPGSITHQANGQDALPESWTIPGTSLTVVRQENEDGQIRYVFSAATVKRIATDYAMIRHEPDLHPWIEENLYEYYTITPGGLIAPQWYKIVHDGPEWLHNEIAGQALWKWMSLAVVAVAYIGGFLLYSKWANGKTSQSRKPDHVTLDDLARPVLVVLAAGLLIWIGSSQINISGPILIMSTNIITMVVWGAIAWFTYDLLQILYQWVHKAQKASNAGLDVNLLRVSFKVISFCIAIIIVGYGATTIGIPVYGVVAGLGVGGIAIALAAQPTIENLIGGIILYIDNMIRVGDFCKIGDVTGTVEDIGIRSTRIRALDRTLITVANADVAKSKIVNYRHRDVFLFKQSIGLRYETPSDAVLKIVNELTELLEKDEKFLSSPLRVKLSEFGDYSIVIGIYANIQATDFNDYMDTQQRILISIREIIERNGSDFAFPSSTVYLGRDVTAGPETNAILSS